MKPIADIYLKATVAKIKSSYPAYLKADAAAFPRVEVYNISETQPEEKSWGLRRVTAVVEAIANDAVTAKTMIGNMAEVLLGADMITSAGVSDIYTEMISCISMTETDSASRMIYRETMNVETTLNI